MKVLAAMIMVVNSKLVKHYFYRYFSVCLLMLFTACHNKTGDSSVIMTINVGDYQEDSFDWKSKFGNELHLVELTDTSKEYSLTEISILVY